MADDREPYGRIVRETWVAWACEQRDRKLSWLVPWDNLDAGQREVDMRIGSAVAAKAVHDAGFDQAQLAADIIRLRVRLDHAVQNERDTIARAILDRADKATPGVERDALLTAAAIAKGTEGSAP